MDKMPGNSREALLSAMAGRAEPGPARRGGPGSHESPATANGPGRLLPPATDIIAMQGNPLTVIVLLGCHGAR